LSALARRMNAQQALALPLPAASNTVVINARCSLRIELDQRVIVVAGLPPTMRGFKIAHGKLGKQLRSVRDRVAQLSAQRQDLPPRVEVRDLNERAVVKLATERKHLTDIIKMVAYQAESDLLALMRPHYARAGSRGANAAA